MCDITKKWYSDKIFFYRVLVLSVAMYNIKELVHG